MDLASLQKIMAADIASLTTHGEAALRYNLLNLLQPITALIGETHMPFSVKDVTEEDVYAAMKLMQPGMVFVTRTKGQLDDIAIPGWWTHVATATDSQHVVEAIGTGVKATGIMAFLLRKDYAVLLKPKFATDDQMKVAAQFCVNQIGAKYDWDFLPAQTTAQLDAEGVTNRAFYCAKLPWAAYKEACGDNVPWTTSLTLGVQTVTPADYVAAVDKWELVWASPSAAAHVASPSS